MKSNKRLHAIYLILVLFGLHAVCKAQGAAEGAAKPALTSEQKKDVLLAARDLEVAQLRAQIVMVELEKARAAFEKAKADITPPGFALNEKLDLVKVPEAKPETKPVAGP